MSDFVQQNSSVCAFGKSESWVILSSIEQTIKQKIEGVGIPLRNWDIKINYGIKTGFNPAFIIDEEKRSKILNSCSSEQERLRTDEIIRPILRGRDIKKYGYDWAGLYLICTFPSRKYNIDDYPALKAYLLSFDERVLAQSGEKDINGIKGKNARKKTCNKWFETQDSIGYWDDFNKQKIVYREISLDSMNACLVDATYVLNNKCYFITGEHLIYLLCILNSSLFTKVYFSSTNTTGGKGGPAFLYNVYIPKPNKEQESLFVNLYNSYKNGALKESEFNKLIDNAVNKIYEL